MCKCCSTAQKQYWVFGCGVFLLLLALIVGLLWPTLAWNILYSQLRLGDGSPNYDNWIETPLPMYMEITMFNWTNTHEVHNPDVKPLLVECGPYVFLENHKRTNVTWNENGTVTYNQIRTWQFVPDLSNGTLDDEITTLNMISASVAYAVRNDGPLIKLGVNVILNTLGGSLFVTEKVGEFLYDGYHDPLLDYLKSTNSTVFNIPFDRFGWFVDRNNSWSYDGTFNMNTGENDMTKMGMLNEWNYHSKTDFYSGGCSAINGTTGELWPPKINSDGDLTLFVSDICRSVSLAPTSETIERHGVTASKWIGDYRVFDNGVNYPPNECFCTADETECPDLAPGLYNVSDCRFGAPVFISYPHFYLADPSYVEAIDGLNPSKEEHEFAMSLQADTGIPVEVNARMQLNVLLQPVTGLALYTNVPHIMVPMFWFTQRVELDETLAGRARLAVMLPSVGVYASYGILGLGAILLIVGITLTLTNKWNSHTRFQNESDNELET
ncbi:protein croquemort-like [Bradysia coprophila]|uniref:protein croquemort-like n=1 Tax=Bradysia coprophila TaxID=38358 RepID=UPI00187DACC4|nr:protein croquemort-like [Bradysia coprophila]XP_037024620.1 protein croquemort-like [Bradysia coprophila]XP_037024621.1 protein croquemort-like [Bradysia coprophila]